MMKRCEQNRLGRSVAAANALMASAAAIVALAVGGLTGCGSMGGGEREGMLPGAQHPLYRCVHAEGRVTIDGHAEKVWDAAPWTAEFVDIEGTPREGHTRPRFRTRAKMLWDNAHLYIYAEMEEPHVWGTLTERNSIIFQDNDFEVFIDPDGDGEDYYEFEVNTLGTIMELVLDKPYSEGGHYTFVEMIGVRWAVGVDGTLNDPGDKDDGWRVEIAIPFAGLDGLIDGVGPGWVPDPGERWRVNFSRVQWSHRVTAEGYKKIPKTEKAEDNWVWSPTGVIDMHRPEEWGVVEFVGR